MSIPARIYKDNEGLPLINLKRFSKNINVHALRRELISLGFSETEAGLGKFVKTPEEGTKFVGAIMAPTKTKKSGGEMSAAFEKAQANTK